MTVSQQSEINLTELSAAIYLFFMRKWLFIIILTITGLMIGFLSDSKEPPALLYIMNVKMSSSVIKPILIKNALSNIWCDPCDVAGIEESRVFSKEISTEIISVKKVDDSLMIDNKNLNTIMITFFIDDSAKTQIAINDIINFLMSQDTIKSIIKRYRIFYKNYMSKLDEKITEIEAVQKIFQPGTGDKKLESAIIKGWHTSNLEYLKLLEKRFYWQIWDDSENPITAEIISVGKTVTGSLARRLVLWGFSSFMIAVFLGFAYDFHIKVLSHIRENAVRK